MTALRCCSFNRLRWGNWSLTLVNWSEIFDGEGREGGGSVVHHEKMTGFVSFIRRRQIHLRRLSGSLCQSFGANTNSHLRHSKKSREKRRHVGLCLCFHISIIPLALSFDVAIIFHAVRKSCQYVTDNQIGTSYYVFFCFYRLKGLSLENFLSEGEEPWGVKSFPPRDKIMKPKRLREFMANSEAKLVFVWDGLVTTMWLQMMHFKMWLA